jgi:predicted nucleotide-binding protein
LKVATALTHLFHVHGGETEAPPRRVFVVHGRDEGLRDQVARVLDRLDFEVVTLSEEPHRGRTLIEKFEDETLGIGYAVVILSPDDWGRGPDEEEWPEGPNRGRQNVILELGYFMGRLGRRRVTALSAPGVELPSDIHGLGYVTLRQADWPFKLAAELEAAGFHVDLNWLSHERTGSVTRSRAPGMGEDLRKT